MRECSCDISRLYFTPHVQGTATQGAEVSQAAIGAAGFTYSVMILCFCASTTQSQKKTIIFNR